MPSYEYLDYGSPDGAIFGRTTSEKIGFYGTAPLAQQSINSAVSTTLSVSTSGVYGFTTSTETMQIVNAVSTMAYALKQLGLVA